MATLEWFCERGDRMQVNQARNNLGFYILMYSVIYLVSFRTPFSSRGRDMNHLGTV